MDPDGDHGEGHRSQGQRPPLSSVPGIDQFVVLKLAEARVADVHSLLAWPETELCKAAGLDRAALRAACTAVHARYAARRQCAADIYASVNAASAAVSATPVHRDRFPNPQLRNRSPLALCGARPGDIVELVGLPCSGKTQLCLTAAAAVASSGRGVVLLDSTSALSVDRIDSILSACGLDRSIIGNALDRVITIPVGTLAAAEVALTALTNDILAVKAMWIALGLGGHADTTMDDAALICAALADVGLIVFDSPASLLAPVLGWKWSDGWTGYASSNQISGFLRRLSTLTHAPVLMTNRQAKGDRDSDQQRAALGRSWSHVPDVRVYLEARSPAEDDDDHSTLFVNRQIQFKRTRTCSSTLLQIDAMGVCEHEPA
jgi:RAD51-like protein 3